ncbi:MAG: secretin N-terminal domain-containing protein [Bacteroidota bacterium]
MLKRIVLSLSLCLLCGLAHPAGAVELGNVKVFPLKHAQASVLSDQLKELLQDQSIKIMLDGRSNSLILRGEPKVLETATSLAAQLDIPEQFRIFRLRYLDPVEAIEILRSGPFNDGKIPTNGPQVHAITNVASPDTTEQKLAFPVENRSPKFVPISRDNTLMVIGSPQDFRIVETLLKSIDKRARQVVIQTQILEITDTGENTLGVNFNTQTGGMTATSIPGDNRLHFDTVTRRASSIQLEINALIRSNKAKMLASPSVLAMNERKSSIQIVDNIIEKVDSVTTQNSNTAVTAKTITQGSTGITLEILPRINDEGFIILYVHPQISFVREKVLNQTGDLMATLKSTREFQAQELMVKDGDTLVIGGLIQDRTSDVVEKMPFVGDIPFLGRLFQRRSVETTRTEVRIFITPQILAESEETHDNPAKS